MYVNHKDLNEFLKQMKRQKTNQIIPKSKRMKRWKPTGKYRKIPENRIKWDEKVGNLHYDKSD